MANICERMHGDINDVRRGIGHDQRIGFAFLHPGVGYGGSCFPKDVRALASMARELGIEPSIMEAVDAVNEKQKFIMPNKVAEHFEENLKGRTIAVWGLAFKPRTDDIREAPALTLIKYLLNHEATVRVHDPEAIENVKKIFGEKISYSTDVIETLRGADALVINTEWAEYRNLDLGEIKDAMNSAVIFDGRNLYETSDMQEAGFTYYSIGRPKVCSHKS
jgi:UDPglucose 6-dehydrogenase